MFTFNYSNFVLKLPKKQLKFWLLVKKKFLNAKVFCIRRNIYRKNWGQICKLCINSIRLNKWIEYVFNQTRGKDVFYFVFMSWKIKILGYFYQLKYCRLIRSIQWSNTFFLVLFQILETPKTFHFVLTTVFIK